MFSRHVLDVGRQDDPGMHALFVHRERWSRKARFGKRANRNGDMFCVALKFVVHGGTALRAEMKCGSASFVADADISR